MASLSVGGGFTVLASPRSSFTRLSASVGAAATKFAAAQSARATSKSATIEQNAALDELADLGAQLIKIIRAFGLQTGSDEVFALAQIPLPKEPEPIAPVNPSNLRFTLLQNGALELKWDGVKSNGTTFIVYRSVVPGPGESPTPMLSIASVGAKEYEDSTIPAGAVSATYVVRALKGDQLTPGSSPVTANFSYNLNNGQQELQLAA
jgi:hypothetical protein